ncbi:arsenate reductase/protein-tyrosine-phosphatase family protein [Microbacterium phyllosphaerae]|uniref:arsenate reductase/protein-tyrosine-phosphatase family protein n=1 Tax=Microbacterium phyllosphaerae TaxID=124798 RepID=UPI002168799C|nr:helix-turn-helix domain-containing protein [Microbacterium phyllosphaerae]MCS3442687.1 protein-tyrosine-phosphatase/DNA-binding HxlR family transcriptional regulator [Microbacterium phyllosphaerae]
MNIERQQNAEERAAKHAALGDPSRLRIVDLLTLGDLSPSEISVALGLPSNLVTHHLNGLESVGMVSRSRSEADKRRNYVHLVDSALDGLTPGRVDRASRVVFVCTANSARSQLAAALWSAHSSIPATSAGTHPAGRIDPGAVAVAGRHAIDLSDGPPRTLDSVWDESDLVVTVCDNAHEEIGISGHLHWSIPDPVRVGTDDAFDTAFDELERRITALAPRLAAIQPHPKEIP